MKEFSAKCVEAGFSLCGCRLHETPKKVNHPTSLISREMYLMLYRAMVHTLVSGETQEPRKGPVITHTSLCIIPLPYFLVWRSLKPDCDHPMRQQISITYTRLGEDAAATYLGLSKFRTNGTRLRN